MGLSDARGRVYIPYGRALLLVCFAMLLASAITFVNPQKIFSQGTAGGITGYAWSDTVGWISLNGATYGLTVSEAGVISGYAWSDNVGWISANASDLSGCPSAPCTATISGGTFAGWLRAIGGGGAQSGDWDGFISLSGGGYSVTQTGSAVSGYAWGSTNLGWVLFDAQTSYAACAATQGYYCASDVSMYRDSQCVVSVNQDCTSLGAGWFCGDTGLCVAPSAPSCAGGEPCITASPQLIVPGQTVLVSWNVSDATSCTVSEDNPNVTDSWSTLSGANTSSELSQATTYTLSCVGDGGILTGSVTVSLRPGWREI